MNGMMLMMMIGERKFLEAVQVVFPVNKLCISGSVKNSFADNSICGKNFIPRVAASHIKCKSIL